MMKKLNLSDGLFAAALLCIFSGIGGNAFAEAIKNAQCLAVGNLTCQTLSAVQCLQQNASGDCLHCSSATALPNKMCIAVEGKSCNPNGTVVYCGLQFLGTCVKAQGCSQLMAAGNCFGVAQCN